MEPLLKSIISSVPGLRTFIWRTAYYPKLGLMTQDMYCPIKNKVIQEAIRRLPPDVAAQRALRLNRAIILAMSNKTCPQDEWMTPEKDEAYMNDAIAQVEAEFRLKGEFAEKLYAFDPIKAKVTAGSLREALNPGQ
ncbi:cytochrome b-c1 complex subunit 7-like [Mya arenaria]|uniref:cytochrome b-c1 complex subunit 7-like n=1 Tax=Mya arenaria TaxID=6604 RepID=UPI0022E534AB|nr:cytochrome b-c1 complex subunit 7-like [Mya arenaria]